MASGEPRSRNRADPYLSSLSGDAAERVTIMKWARYLGATFGTTGALRALQYYREVNWISDSVKRTMTEYVRGLPIEDLDRQDDADTSLTDALSSLEGTHFEHHAKSLEFIAAIGDNNIEHSLASLQLTENGSMGLSGTGGDLSGRSADLFTAPGFDEADRLSEDAIGQVAPEDRGRDRASPSNEEPSRQPRQDRAERGDRETTTREPRTGRSDRVADSTAPSDETAASTVDASPSGSDPQAEQPAGEERRDPRAHDGRNEGGDSNRPAPARSEEPAATPQAPSSGNATATTPNEGGSSSVQAETESRDDESSSDAGDGEPSTDEMPPDQERCIALTRDGERCSRRAMERSDYCRQHAP